MDRESAKLVLKWDGVNDFDDHIEACLFQFKKEYILLSHPKLIQKKINQFNLLTDAIGFIKGVRFEKNEPSVEVQDLESDFLDTYRKYELRKSKLKLQIQATFDINDLYSYIKSYQELFLNWHRTLSNIKVSNLDCSGVKQSKESNPIELFDDIKSWSKEKYSPELIQKTNFAVLYNEICRSRIILEQL